MEGVCHKVFALVIIFCLTFIFFYHSILLNLKLFSLQLSLSFNFAQLIRFNIPTIREFYGSTEGTYGTINIRSKEVSE